MLINLIFLFLNYLLLSFSFDLPRIVSRPVDLVILSALSVALMWILSRSFKSLWRFIIGVNCLISINAVYLLDIIQPQIGVLYSAVALVALQFLGLFIAYAFRTKKPLSNTAKNSLRFLFPFTLPFLAATALAEFFPNNDWLLLVFLIALFCFYPRLLCYLWGCRSIPLSSSTQNLLKKTKMQNTAFLNWPVFDQSATAAIVGVFPRFRSILLTKKLMKCLSEDEIDAVIVHEIGHHKSKHLVFYPVLLIPLAFLIDLVTLVPYLNENTLFTYPLIVVIICAYFRIVMGFFTRLFERQADLYPLKVGLKPEALQNALKRVAMLSGTPNDKPNWHHYSIQERIDMIERAHLDTKLILQHDKRSFNSRLIFILIAVITAFTTYKIIGV
ncbi:MAG: M48 family metalloprotease [Parachlamydiales bacterium]|nr:M48 family metalloprotease [Parachlamydiales bacterium]